MEPLEHPPGRLRPTKARAGDRFDLALLGAAGGYLIANGHQTLDALSIQELVGRTGAIAYLTALIIIGLCAVVVRDERKVGVLMLTAAAIVLTIASAAVVVRGLDQALLPVALYIIAGRRLADRAWYLEESGGGKTRRFK